MLVEKVRTGSSYFSCVLFEKAKGKAPGEAKDWDSNLFHSMGRFVGRMHYLTLSCVQAESRFRRPQWWNETEVVMAKRLPSSEQRIVSKYHGIYEQLMELERPVNSYGLVHADFRRENFFVENGNITLFDFDDCQYSWFAQSSANSSPFDITSWCCLFTLWLRVSTLGRVDTLHYYPKCGRQ